MTSAAELTGTVRGRRFCFEVAQRSDPAVRRAMGPLALRVMLERGDIARGAVATLMAEDPAAPPEPAPPPGRPLREVLLAMDAVLAVQDVDLLEALSDTVTSAMYWQPPHAEDAVLAGREVAAALRPLASALLADPRAAWWSGRLAAGAQVTTHFESSVPSDGPASERLERWREDLVRLERDVARHRAAHPGNAVGGTWWVVPSTAGLTETTRALGDAGSAALWLTEDELGWTTAQLQSAVVDGAPRLLEIHGPADWAALVAAHPLDVTDSRGPDWYGAVDARPGRWLVPDWSAVARSYDAVHVGVMGWLLTSGMSVPVGSSWTTLAGWNPDATWWLADVVRPTGTVRRWDRDDDGRWHGAEPAVPQS